MCANFDTTLLPGVQLRDYQRSAVEAAVAAVERRTNPVIVLPTGAGKSLVIAGIAGRFADRGVIVAAHRAELVSQNAAAWERATGMRPAIMCAGLGRYETGPVTFASVQTAASRTALLGPARVIIVDECHLIPSDPNSRYRRLVGSLPEASIVGLSATPYRLDSGNVVDHPDIPLDEVVIDVPVDLLVKQGWLSPVVLDERINGSIDISGVKKRGGEFAANEVAKRAAVEDLVARQIEICMGEFAGRRSILVFCIGREHVGMVTDILARRGERVASVTEATPQAERRRLLEDFRNGDIRWMANCDVLTTGFDAPCIDGIVVLRPTCSKALFVQMIGRGFRRAADKNDCLVLDFGGNVSRHEPLDAITESIRTDGGRRRERAEVSPVGKRGTWFDRALANGGEDYGICRVVVWRPKVEPSRSCPGTMHVRLQVLLETPAGRKWANVWYTPEHRNMFARYRAFQIAGKIGMTGPVDAAALAMGLGRARPATVRAIVDDKGFWMISW